MSSDSSQSLKRHCYHPSLPPSLLLTLIYRLERRPTIIRCAGALKLQIREEGISGLVLGVHLDDVLEGFPRRGCVLSLPGDQSLKRCIWKKFRRSTR